MWLESHHTATKIPAVAQSRGSPASSASAINAPWVTKFGCGVQNDPGVNRYDGHSESLSGSLALGFRAIGDAFRCVSGCPYGEEAPVSPFPL